MSVQAIGIDWRCGDQRKPVFARKVGISLSALFPSFSTLGNEVQLFPGGR